MIKNKKRIFTILIFAMFFAAVPLVSASDISTIQTGSNAKDFISVTDVKVSPEVFMPGDSGTIKVTIQNTGINSVDINRAKIYSKDVSVMSDGEYDTVGSLGPGNKMDFTFTIKAKQSNGINYPDFYLDFSGSGSLNYPVPVKVEDKEILISVTEKPDTFSKGKKDKIILTIANPRENEINGINILPSSDSAEFSQTGRFIGSLKPDESKTIEFEITPENEGEAVFFANYKNGMNDHISKINIPLNFGKDKKSAEPVLNNIITEYGRMTGDITNSGLEEAKSVIVTVKEPAVPKEPYPVYVVGSLEPDDFSGFEITYDSNGESKIPLVVKYKDKDGNNYEFVQNINTDQSELTMAVSKNSQENSASAKAEQSGGSPIVLLILTAVVAGIGYCAVKKTGLLSKKRCKPE
ncbi:hypothetical protein F1737_05630 [Methanoplanus sp. FWC-SCC4]|uniref:CARDB domain-containing protein n=1 Tax=Methanochimaera problematica TaxID=2609417 RepID=A0AA97FC39_9EURY|nr:hypothetical protein [Methanoplanus sp. FWC-SCC4]WOF16224.1 hypothetical protein F1737_05630 [Methanoplanus sp. FWC-SCC4]